MRHEDQLSSLTSQVERADNEGMVAVPPPRAHVEEEGDLEDTKNTARRLLGLQLVAEHAYESTLQALGGTDDAKTIAVVAEQLRKDIDVTRAQLARLHDLAPIEAPAASKAIEKATGIAAGMLGEAVTAKGLMIGELAMAHTAAAMLERGNIIPEVAEELRRATVEASKARAATLRLIA